MAHVVIIFATNSGSTGLSAEIIGNELREQGHEVELINAGIAKVEDLTRGDVTVLGSPSWDHRNEAGERLEGQPHKDMMALLEAAGAVNLEGQTFGVFGMGDTSYTYFCGAVDHMEDFVNQHGGELLGESLRIDGFYFQQEANEKMVHGWAKQLGERL